jgi:hypothetical protein
MALSDMANVRGVSIRSDTLSTDDDCNESQESVRSMDLQSIKPIDCERERARHEWKRVRSKGKTRGTWAERNRRQLYSET